MGDRISAREDLATLQLTGKSVGRKKSMVVGGSSDGTDDNEENDKGSGETHKGGD